MEPCIFKPILSIIYETWRCPIATMQMTEKIYEQALDLPTGDRLILIDKLLHSTNLPTQLEVDTLWAEEVERRSKEIETGKARLIPGEEVFEKIKKRFGK